MIAGTRRNNNLIKNRENKMDKDENQGDRKTAARKKLVEMKKGFQRCWGKEEGGRK